ncbi:Sucrase/ferredoxin-like-domain-containing protein [Cyathus striatus]|nr:Sucrase/ferredoxin-like-domain-containing protein [Cyathus striatus]
MRLTAPSSLHRAFSTAKRPLTPLPTTAAPPPTPPPDSKKEKPLFASAPSHTSYILLHAPRAPPTYPSRLSTPVQRALLLHARQWGGAVNFSWLGEKDHTKEVREAEEEGWETKEEQYSITAFSRNGRLELRNVSLEDIDSAAGSLKLHAVEVSRTPTKEDEEVHIYVCTHAERDCRCGDLGGAVADALRAEVKKAEEFGLTKGKRIRIGEVAHVGGHAFAANLLVYPSGEWLGLVSPSDAPGVIHRVLNTPNRPLLEEDPPVWVEKWRGRMGMGKEGLESVLKRFGLDAPGVRA